MATDVSTELWDEFHTVVNMTSRELQDWLRTRSSGPRAESLPDKAGPELGRQVLGILAKRRTDVTEQDIRTMHTVVGLVRDMHDPTDDGAAGGAAWRRRLMDIGHDPLKPQ